MSKKHPIQLSDHFTYARLFRFVLPSIVMMVFTSIYGVVDGLFVSNFAGKTAFASINLIMPFLIILGAMGFMLGTGGTALVSRVLGEGDKERANKYFSMITLFGILLGVILTVVGVLAMRPMAILLGATEAMVDDCVLYGRIVVCFLTSFMLQNMFQSFLIAAERPKFGLLITLAAGVTNMVLDALFVGVFRWGIAGAAIATGISQTVGGVVPLMYFLFSKSSPLRLRWTKFEAQPLLRSCANGSSELMSNISGSLIGMLYNAQLMRFLGEDGVATYGVLMYVQFIFVAIDIGYSIGCAPIISYHYGAQNHPELRNLLTKGLKVMGILGIVMTIAAISLSGTLANIFVGYDATLCELTRHAFHLFSFAFLLAGFNIFLSSFFTALNNGGVSAAISFLRTLVFQAASVILLPMALDVDGLWWAASAAEALAFVVSIGFLLALKGKYHYFDES
jgi:putative MATE family efflux protein